MTNHDTPKVPVLSLEDAEHQIRFVMQRIAQVGRNDSENDNILHIIRELQAGNISPIDAVAAAERIEHDKQEH